MTKLKLINLIAKTDRPANVNVVRFSEACRDAVEFAFAHWIPDMGQDHAKNEGLIAACIKKRDELLSV